MALPDLIGGIGARSALRHPAACPWREDVAALAVGVLDQRDVAGAVRIVLDALDHALDAVLVATEVDDAVLVLRPLPWWRVVMRPTLLRPAWRFFLEVSGSNGPPLCRCDLSSLTTKRVPGEVGFILMTGISNYLTP
jgi:hypothetical protein